MPTRPLAALAAALCACGLVLSAASATPSRAQTAPSPAKVGVEGTVVDWDAQDGTLALEEAAFSGAPKRLRRALRQADAVELVLAWRTRIVAESTDGTRAPMSADALMEELEATGEDVDVEASGRLQPGSLRPGKVPTVVAKRVLVFLPDPDLAEDPEDLDDDPGDEEPEPDPDPAP